MKRKHSWLLLAAYLVFTLAPIYWMLHMSLRSNLAITSTFAWLPESLSLANYATIFTDPAWYDGYLNSIIYVVLNTILSVTVALPAASCDSSAARRRDACRRGTSSARRRMRRVVRPRPTEPC